MKIQLEIKGDTNDGDYVTEISTINKKELEFVKKVCAVIKASPGNDREHNWPSSWHQSDSPTNLYEDELTEGDIDKFENWVPHGEHGIHSIVSVKYKEVHSSQKLI